MILFNRVALFLIAFTLVFSCSTKEKMFVPYSNSEITYSGRIDSLQQDEGVALYWSGTSIKLVFEGSSIAALLEDESGDNYYNIIIDNGSPAILRPDTNKRFHILGSRLSEGKHTIEVFRRTEWNRGKTAFYGFQIEGEAKVLPKPSTPKRRIEFYGNSITAGYAVEDVSGRDSPDSIFTNNYLSYAAITARHYDAEFQCICKSGIGVTVSWFPLIMPQIYDRLIPTDTASKWDFSQYSPNIVVVNLLQNDSWLVNMPESEEFKVSFGDTSPSDEYVINEYKKFVGDLRKHYPHSSIICMLGNMDITQKGSKWMSYVEKAVANLNDENIHTHFEPFKETPGHPSIKEQEAMAKSLIQFIDKNIEW